MCLTIVVMVQSAYTPSTIYRGGMDFPTGLGRKKESKNNKTSKKRNPKPNRSRNLNKSEIFG